MGVRTQRFDHLLPAPPVCTKGMRAGASGVSAPPLQTIGLMTATSAADGSFSDTQGHGQIDYDTAGYLYVADPGNQRVQRFTKSAVTGAYAYDSKCSALNALGSAVTLNLCAIDRTRNQIHLASSSQILTGTWVSVYNLTDWPNLTSGNRVRQYGTNASAPGSGNARTGIGLTLVGDHAYVVSAASDFRVLKWNILTGALVAQQTKSAAAARIASDGTRFYAGSQGNTEVGVWRFNETTLVGITRLDSNLPSGFRYTRRNRFLLNGDCLDLIHHKGLIYARESGHSRIFAYDPLTDTFVDEFAWPGGASLTETFGHFPGEMFSLAVAGGKLGSYVPPDDTRSDDLMVWSGNGGPALNAQTSFLTVWPTSIATATWVFSEWSAEPSTIKVFSVAGKDLSAEKMRVRAKKDGGAWVVFTLDQLLDESRWATLGTFVEGNILTIELDLCAWFRLDGHSVLVATRDKLAPQNVIGRLEWDDPAADVFVPQPTGALEIELSDAGGVAVEV